MYEITNSTIALSVRGLVEFVLKSGDIDNRRKGGKDAMLAGGRIHRMIQKKMGSGYQAEVPLGRLCSLTPYLEELRREPGEFPYEISETLEISLQIDGRADGIMEQEEGVLIDEIKGTYRNVTRIEAPEPVHVAQAVCYGYMYAAERGLPQVIIQITYCNMETEEICRFPELYSFERLEEEFNSYLREYTKWAAFLICHRAARNASIRTIEFPFDYRPGQRDLVVSVYRTIARQKNLFIQAPTGIGKTLSAIFPSVKAMGEERVEKLFYLTAKTIARSVAEENMQILQSRGLQLSALTITAKEKVCPMAKMECNPVACPMAKGYFERTNEAVFDFICHEQTADRERILAFANKHRVCPFEFTLDLSYWVDAIICDYNYVFDPNVYLQRYFADGAQGKYVFLVDEAHNMVDRAREMYSAVLMKEMFLEAKKWYEGFVQITRKINRCNRQLLALKRQCEKYRVIEPEELSDLVRNLELIYTELQEFPDKYPDVTLPPEAGDFFFAVRDFLQVYEEVDENYTVYTELLEDGSFMVRLYCVNPARNLRLRMNRGISTVYFSATMLPIQYYKRLLGGDEEAYAVYVPSPFAEENRLLCISRDVTSKYTRRGPAEYQRIARYIWEISSAMKGNYLVFFPSYQFLTEVRDAFLEFCEEEKQAVVEEELIPVEEIRKIPEQSEEIAQDGILLENPTAEQTIEITQTAEAEFAQASLALPELTLQAENESENSRELKPYFRSGLTCHRIQTPEKEIRLYEQQNSMTESERSAFLSQFTEGSEQYRIGMCVIGGSFSEGIDLTEDRLIGVIVVGTGLPQLCTERELLKQHFDRQDGNGFAFAYLYPGMNKVLQAAGRLIRTPQDVGVIALLDERFYRSEYMELFPREWSRYKPVCVDNVAEAVGDFWVQL